MSETRAAHEQTDEQRRIAQIEAALASATSELVATRSELAAAQSTIERLRGKYLQLLEKVALLERRILVGKAERVDASADQLVLASTRASRLWFGHTVAPSENALGASTSV